MSRQSAYSYEGGGYGVQRLLLDALKAVFSSFWDTRAFCLARAQWSVDWVWLHVWLSVSLAHLDKCGHTGVHTPKPHSPTTHTHSHTLTQTHAHTLTPSRTYNTHTHTLSHSHTHFPWLDVQLSYHESPGPVGLDGYSFFPILFSELASFSILIILYYAHYKMQELYFTTQN